MFTNVREDGNTVYAMTRKAVEFPLPDGSPSQDVRTLEYGDGRINDGVSVDESNDSQGPLPQR